MSDKKNISVRQRVAGGRRGLRGRVERGSERGPARRGPTRCRPRRPACKPSAECQWGMQVDASALRVGAGVGVSGPEAREREGRKEETRMR